MEKRKVKEAARDKNKERSSKKSQMLQKSSSTRLSYSVAMDYEDVADNEIEDTALDKKIKYEITAKKLAEKNMTKLFGHHSRSFAPDKIKIHKDLPCPGFANAKFKKKLSVEVRIWQGSKVLSFNDTDYHTDQQLSEQSN